MPKGMSLKKESGAKRQLYHSFSRSENCLLSSKQHDKCTKASVCKGKQVGFCAAFFLAISHLKVGEEHSHCPKNFCKMPRIFFILLLRTRTIHPASLLRFTDRLKSTLYTFCVVLSSFLVERERDKC